MINNLLRDNSKQKYILFDYETESLRLIGKNRGWQLSYLLAEGSEIKEIKDYYLRWPDLNVSAGAQIQTGFDQAKYNQTAQDPGPILEEIDSYFNNPEYIVMGHNIYGFDFYVHKNNKEELGVKNDWSYIDRAIDTMCLAKIIKLEAEPEIKRENYKQIMFKYVDHVKRGLKTSLKVLAKEHEIEFEEEKLHDAKYDIELNWKIWNKLKFNIDI